MLKLQWTDDLKAESDFRMMGIPFEKVRIPFSKIDLKESGFNSARFEPVIPGLVSDYSQAMRNGDVFPRIVAYRKGSYILTSGNQRSLAIKSLIADGALAKDVVVEIYDLQTSDAMLIEAVTRSANVSHGGRATWEERKAHACKMVAEYGMATADAAKLFTLSQATINNQITSNKTRVALGESGINAASVPSSVLNTVARLDQDSSVFLKVGHLVAQHGPSGEQVKRYVDRIKKARSEDQRLGLVKKIEKELTEQAKTFGNTKKARLSSPRVPLRPRRDQFVAQLTKLANFLDFGKAGEGFSKLSELQVSVAADSQLVSDSWERIELRMSLIMKGRK